MASDAIPAYPLILRPIYKKKVWGGRELEQLGRDLPGDDDALIGESWELADLSQTSASGSGGGAERSTIANGPLADQTIGDAIAALGDRLTGSMQLPNGAFPVLVKYLNSREPLSVQVHPSEAYAAEHPDAHLKSEAWYIVDAKPGAVIYKGIREGVTPDQFRKAIEANDAAMIESMMIKTPVKRGDCHYLPSGTCHALGAGIVVAEVQTPSDTTFRVYDWGRPRNTGRELHIEQAMRCIHFGPPDVSHYERRSHIAGMFTAVSRLIECEHFRIEKVRMIESYEQEVPYTEPAVWMVLEGSGRIALSDTDDVAFTRGQTLLLPAKMNNPVVKLDADTVWLEITFPRMHPMLMA
jgi:mannose-6-phosphate isomerase